MDTRYLDLLEKALGDGLHGRACRPLPEHGRRHVWWSPLMRACCTVARQFGLVLALPAESGWPALGDTMLGIVGLRNIRDVLVTCHDEHVPGDFVECGCWRGGACIYARAVINELGDSRRVFGCDSFDGLPRPSTGDNPRDPHYKFSALVAPLTHAKTLPAKYNVGPVQWVPGFFCNTLPGLTRIIPQIAVLRCDADMYSSTRDILFNLYPLVTRGGFVIIDDWLLPACQQAVRDHINPLPPVETVTENGGVMFRKP